MDKCCGHLEDKKLEGKQDCMKDSDAMSCMHGMHSMCCMTPTPMM